jgi:hypothetical protein
MNGLGVQDAIERCLPRLTSIHKSVDGARFAVAGTYQN